MLELVEIKDQGQLQPFFKKNNFNRTKSFLDNKETKVFLKMKQQMEKTNRRNPHIKVVRKFCTSCHVKQQS